MARSATKPRAPKRVINGDARGRILLAAQRLFAERGFQGASTKTIAAAAGVPSGLVFYYFATKEQLIDAIFEENVAAEMGEIFTSISRTAPAHEALSAVLLGLLRWMDAHRDQAFILVGEIASRRPIAKRLREIRATALKSLAEFLEKRGMAGKRSGVDSKVAAQALSSALIFATVLERPSDLATYADELANLIVPRGKGRRR